MALFLSRRRFLAASAATLAASGARAQESLYGVQIEPQVGYGVESDEAIDPAEWYVGRIPDGRFYIQRGNFEKLDPEFRRQLVRIDFEATPGTIVIDPAQHFLYSIREGRTAVRYGVGTGREGFSWSGNAQVARKAEWPDWHPPKEMILRQP